MKTDVSKLFYVMLSALLNGTSLKVHILGSFAFAILVTVVSERRCVGRNDRGPSI